MSDSLPELSPMTPAEESVYFKLTSLTAKIHLIGMFIGIGIIVLLLFTFPYYKIETMSAPDSLFFVAAVLLCYRIIRTGSVGRREIALDKKQASAFVVEGQISLSSSGIYNKRFFFGIDETKYQVPESVFREYKDGASVKIRVTPRTLVAVATKTKIGR